MSGFGENDAASPRGRSMIVAAAPTAAAAPQVSHAWRMTVLLLLAFVALTAADIGTTLLALANGDAVELNPNAARAGGSIRIGFLVLSNTALLLPLLVAFHFGVTHATRVPPGVLARWWRHILDIFYISPLNDGARARSPLRLVTAAMTLLTLKAVIVLGNVMSMFGYPGPTSLLASLWTGIGLDGAPRYWATYALMILPCYVVGVGLAASTLRYARAHLVLALPA